MTDRAITVTAEFSIKQGREEEFLSVIRDHMQFSLDDPGLARFYVHRDLTDPSRFFFYEDWANQASFDESLKAPWRDSYMAATQDLWASPRIIGRWSQEDIRWEARPDAPGNGGEHPSHASPSQ